MKKTKFLYDHSQLIAFKIRFILKKGSLEKICRQVKNARDEVNVRYSECRGRWTPPRPILVTVLRTGRWTINTKLGRGRQFWNNTDTGSFEILHSCPFAYNNPFLDQNLLSNHVIHSQYTFSFSSQSLFASCAFQMKSGMGSQTKNIESKRKYVHETWIKFYELCEFFKTFLSKLLNFLN